MLMSDISIIVRKLRTAADRCGERWGIGFPEQQVLMLLGAHGPSNQEALACQLQIDKGAVARTVAKLEEKGLVTRQVNPANRREKLVSPRPGAEGVLREMWELYQQLEAVAYRGLAPDEIDLTRRCLERIAANLSDPGEEQA